MALASFQQNHTVRVCCVPSSVLCPRFCRYFLTLVDFDGANPRIAFDVEIYKNMKFDKVIASSLSPSHC